MKTLGLIGGTSWHATVEYYSEHKSESGRSDWSNKQIAELIIL